MDMGSEISKRLRSVRHFLWSFGRRICQIFTLRPASLIWICAQRSNKFSSLKSGIFWAFNFDPFTFTRIVSGIFWVTHVIQIRCSPSNFGKNPPCNLQKLARCDVYQVKNITHHIWKYIKPVFVCKCPCIACQVPLFGCLLCFGWLIPNVCFLIPLILLVTSSNYFNISIVNGPCSSMVYLLKVVMSSSQPVELPQGNHHTPQQNRLKSLCKIQNNTINIRWNPHNPSIFPCQNPRFLSCHVLDVQNTAASRLVDGLPQKSAGCLAQMFHLGEAKHAKGIQRWC